MFSETDIPPWMELDTLYLFKYDGPKDTSDFIAKISGRQMHMIEFTNETSMKGNFNLAIEMKDQVNFFGFKYAFIGDQILRASKRAKKTEEEISRTKSDRLFRNIDHFIETFRQKVIFKYDF